MSQLSIKIRETEIYFKNNEKILIALSLMKSNAPSSIDPKSTNLNLEIFDLKSSVSNWVKNAYDIIWVKNRFPPNPIFTQIFMQDIIFKKKL